MKRRLAVSMIGVMAALVYRNIPQSFELSSAMDHPTSRMTAITYREHGSANILEVSDVPLPVPRPTQVKSQMIGLEAGPLLFLGSQSIADRTPPFLARAARHTISALGAGQGGVRISEPMRLQVSAQPVAVVHGAAPKDPRRGHRRRGRVGAAVLAVHQRRPRRCHAPTAREPVGRLCRVCRR